MNRLVYPQMCGFIKTAIGTNILINELLSSIILSKGIENLSKNLLN